MSPPLLLPMLLAFVLAPYRGVTRPLAELWARYGKGPTIGARRRLSFTLDGKRSFWSRLLRGERGSFTVPNEADVGTASLQAEVDKIDFDIVAAGFDVTGVRSGCEVTESGPPAMTIDVAIGTAVVDDTNVAVAAGAGIAIGVADATHPRFDLVVVNNAGVKSVVAGVAAARPVFPAIPANSAVLAAVLVEASTADITDEDITDKRVIIRAAGGLGQQVFNVLDYGALGDGANDDTAAIQNALDAADGAGGGLVYFPSTGSDAYLISADLDVYSNTVCRGDGPSTVVRQETAGVNAFTLDPGGDRIAVRQMTIQSDDAKAGAAIRLDNNRECYVSDVYIDGRDQQADRWEFGINLYDATGPSRLLFFQNFYIQSVSADAGSAGIHIDRETVGVGGWGYNFLGGIVQTSTTTADVLYVTPGNYGLWIEAVDGCHFSDVEIIEWGTPCVIENVDKATTNWITNSKFKSVSFELAGAGNPSVLIRTNGGLVGIDVIQNIEFWGCTFFGNSTGGGLVIDNEDPNDALWELSFADSSFTSDSGAGSGVKISNSGGSLLCRKFSFGNCQFSDATDGVEINDGVSAVQFDDGCMLFPALTNGFDINGADDKELTIRGHIDPAIATPIDLSGYTGSMHDITIDVSPASLIGETSPLYLPTQSTVIDEFISGSLGSGWIGNLGWGLVTLGGGAIVASAGELGHPGIIRLPSGAGIGDFSCIFSYAAARTLGPIDADEDFDITWIVRPIDAAIATAIIEVGLGMDPIATPPNDGFFFDQGALNIIRARVRSGGVDRLIADTGVTWVSTVWRRLRIRRKGADIDFWVDGVLTNNHSGTKPTVALQPYAIIEAGSTASRDLDVDYYSQRLVGLDR